MVFNSVNYLLFLSAFLLIYFAIGQKLRIFWILIASAVFYFFFTPTGLLILCGVILFNFYSGLAIEKSKRKLLMLWLSIAANAGLLFLYKYFNFFNSSFTEILQWAGVQNPMPVLELLAPVGIAFYTLQAIGYNADIYNEIQEPEKKLHVFAAYFLFFPKIAQGPVERPRNLLPQLYDPKGFDYVRVTSGLKLIAWGLFKKVVVADRLAVLVTHVYSDPDTYTGLPLIIGGLFYTLQLYADFSGYTDMALGTAEIMGFKLMKNFNRPFAATSVTDFWKRWHISFSTWLYEYIYNPVSLLKRNWGMWGMIYAIMVTFIISGLWHGASEVFVAWGIINGIALSYELATAKWRKKFWKKISPAWSSFLCKSLTFLFTVMSFTFARSNNLTDAGYIFSHLFDSSKSFSLFSLGLKLPNFIIAIAGIAAIEWVQYYQTKGSVRQMIASKHPVVRWAVYFAALFIIMFLGVFEETQFIYAQF